MRAIRRGPALGWWRALFTGALFAAAAILVIGIVMAVILHHPGWDSRYAYLSAADAVLDGRSPYPLPHDPVLDEEKGYVYPPQLAIAFVPLTVLSVDTAAGVAVLASLAAILGALTIVGVRDPRCYAAVLVWAPAWNAVENANVSGVLVLGVALAWRFRETVWPSAAALGLAVSTKLFLWPLLVWVVAMRRIKAAAMAVAVGLGVTFLAWAVIGFDGLTRYPTLLSRLSALHAEQSYSFVGMAAELGFAPMVGQAVMLIAGGALMAACVILARQGDDRRAFTCAIAASLALTPIVWQHYLAFLIVPLAVARPRFSALWLLPAVLWLIPRDGHGYGLEPFLPALVVVALLAVLLARPRARGVVAEARA